MNLSLPTTHALKNILPYDGTALYYGPIIENSLAQEYLMNLLSSIKWEHDKAVIFGKTLLTKRKVAWYGDQAFSYSYSNHTKLALIWTKELLELKQLVENRTKESYNSCLLNLYHNGLEGMAYHSDGEKDLKPNGAIASLSFGAARKFLFKHKTTKETIGMVLESGSLLVMKENTQRYWLHRLPPSTRVSEARINLTFRTIVNP